MPYYRITIWVKQQRKPLSGIRYIEVADIDRVQLKVEQKAALHFRGSDLLKVEVAMLSKNCSAVKSNQKAILAKSGNI